MLEATSIPETVSFYERLGFTLIGSMGDDPAKPTWCQVKRDNVALMFTWSEPHEHDDGELHSHEPAMAGSLYINVDDVDALFEEFRPALDEVEWEPETFPYGMRDFGVRDPNGYLLIFGSPVD